MRTQGGQANYTGDWLQQNIEARINENYLFVKPKLFQQSKTDHTRIYTRQYPLCNSIYGTPLKCDFIIYDEEKWPNGLVIEAKWQERAGSVDEKYPYLVLNINHQYETPCVIVLDGQGYKPGAEKWLRAQAGAGNLLHVFGLVEFQRWANSGSL